MAFDIKKLRISIEYDDDGVKKAEQDVESFDKKTKHLDDTLKHVGMSLSAMVTVPLVSLGKGAFDAAMKMDSLKRALDTVSGSSEETERQLVRLREVAKMPGLGFAEAIQGSVRLQAAGLSAQMAERSLKAFGNALASVGAGKAELDGVTLALSQIQSKGKVSAEEINQLAERLPQIRKLMVDAFGTADTEILQRAKITSDEFISIIVGAAEKLPEATGGIKNDMENVADSVEKSLGRIGQSVGRVAGPAMQKLADAADMLSEKFQALPKETQDLMVILGTAAAASGPVIMLANQFVELSKAIGLSRLAIVGPAGLIGAVGLLGGLGIADVLNKLLDEDQAKQEKSKYQTLIDQITAKKKDLEDAVKGNLPQVGMLNQEGISGMFSAVGQMLGGGDITKGALNNSADAQSRSGDWRANSAKIQQLRADLASLENQAKETFIEMNRAQADPEIEQMLQGYQTWAQQQEVRRKIQAALHAKELEAAKKHAAALAKIHQDTMDTIFQLTHNEYDNERHELENRLKVLKKAGESEVAMAQLKAATLKDITKRQFQDAMDDLDKLQKKIDIRTAYQGEQSLIARLALIQAGLGTNFGGGPESIAPGLQDIGGRKDTFRYDIRAEQNIRRYTDEMRASARETQREAEIRRYRIASVAGQLSAPIQDAVYAGLNGGNAIGVFRDRMKQSLTSMFADVIGNQVRNLLKDTFTDLTDQMNASLMESMGGMKAIMRQIASFMHAETSALLGAAYAVIAAMSRHKQGGIGSILGGIGGFLLGGPAGAISGYNIGNAIDNGDYAGAIIEAATSYGSGAFTKASGPSGSGGGWTSEGELPSGRAVHVTQNIYGGINNASDMKRVNSDLTRSIKDGLIATG